MGRRIDPRSLSIGELVRMYLAHAESYYRDSEGKPTGEHLNIDAALRTWLLFKVDVELPVIHLSKQDLRRIQAAMIEDGRARTYINATIAKIQRMAKWAVQNDIIEDTPDDAHASRFLGIFAAVEKLKAHRSSAREPQPTQAIELAHVVTTLKYMNTNARDVFEIILRTGARVGEIIQLRAGMIRQDRRDGWFAHPKKHKSAWRGHDRRIPLCSACMRIVKRRMPAPLFEGGAEDAPLFPSQLGRCYTRSGLRAVLRAAIARANAKGHNVPDWHPHQVRYTVAQISRALEGLDDTQALLGHRSRAMTEHYAGNDNPTAARRAQRGVSKHVKAVA